jgi:CheY-like chemotaxis protein
MSFPRTIQPLVIEDDHSAKEYYDTLFQELARRYQLAAPHWAFCYQDATQLLAVDRMYHLVILDLRLPDQPQQPSPETLDFGLAILRECLNRNAYPIPALLVISGNLQRTNQHELEDQVRDGFFYGRVLVKSDNLEHALEAGINNAQRYCDVGLHLRDAGNRVFPTLSPRDEDLLRRCVLAQEQRIGLDVAWWSARHDRFSGWTKTLIGRFLLNEGRGYSLYTFFKLATNQGARTVFREAEVMEQKLKHVKVIGATTASDRSLLITQAAGSGVGPPLSLDEVLGRPAPEIQSSLPGIVTAVAEQVASLGDRTPDQVPVSQLLWPHHDLGRIHNQWHRRGGKDVLSELGAETVEPVELFERLRSSETVVRYDRQSCLHGDLNYTNIALDNHPGGGLVASIFDASGCQAGVSVRDLAMFEVTALLHQETAGEDCLARHCAGLYDQEVGAPAGLDFTRGTPQARNTLRLVAEIRKQVLRVDCPKLYALMVFDNALMQLAGLEFGSSSNKIRNPRDAALLVGLTARWLWCVAPEFTGR